MCDDRVDVGILRQAYGSCHTVPLEFHAQELVHGSQVCDVKFGLQLVLASVEEVSTARGEHQVIDCDYDNNNLPIHVLVEHTVLHCAVCVQEFCEGLANSLIPAVPSLFEAVQGFEQVAYLSLISRGHEAWWLPHIDRLGEFGIEVHVLHVDLMHLPVIVCGKGQHNAI